MPPSIHLNITATLETSYWEVLYSTATLIYISGISIVGKYIHINRAELATVYYQFTILLHYKSFKKKGLIYQKL